jgi:S1-C subfamily serine protease
MLSCREIDVVKYTLGDRVLPTLALVTVVLLVLLSGAKTAAANSLPDTIDKVRPSVVAVGSFHPTGSPRHRFRGTGFVVTNGHLVVTNAHVLPDKLDEDRKEQIAVFSGRGNRARVHPAKVLAEDKRRDLAVLYISDPLPALKLAPDALAREGAEIALTGFPIGMALGLYPVTHRGIVAAISPMAPPQLGSKRLSQKALRAMGPAFDALQLDAIAYPGNSGSPVYDPRTGAVLGVVNSVLVKSTKESALESPTGISYAIPVKFVRSLLAKARQ